MDLDEAADELYAGAPEEFVGRRTALVKQARAAKDRELATAIGNLRKPTRTAWLINLLARDAPDDVSDLLDLGDALREAQANRDGTELRRLSGRRRSAIDSLVKQAVALGREHGHTTTEATTSEIASTLQAALGEPGVAEQVRQGRLASGAVYGGFGSPSEPDADVGGNDLAAALAASIPAATRAKAAEPPEDEVAQRRREAQRREREQAETARDQARSELDDAQSEADETTERADDLAAEVDRLRTELGQAEEAEGAARTTARAARETLRDRREAFDQAEAAVRLLDT